MIEKYEVGEIIQLDPEQIRVPCFAGCLMIITKLLHSGAQGYVQGVGETKNEIGGQFYYRAKWSEMLKTGGYAIWVLQ